MTALTLANRLRGVEGSPTLALAAKAKALAKEGKSVVNFTAGEPDFSTPEPVKDAGIKAISENQTRYTPAAGIPELRSAIAETASRTLRTSYVPAQTVVSCGAKHALFNVLQVLCQPGDEVIVLSPYWVSYPPLVRLSGATPVIVTMREEEAFQPNLEAIRAAVSDATKVIMINSPSNPTGAVTERGRLEALAHLALERGLTVVSDEIYDQLVYPPAEYASIVQVNPRVAGQTIVVNGVSKTYSMTGWRIGYALGPKPIMEAIGVLQSHSTSNPTSISQHAALEAITGDQRSVAEMRSEFQRRRDRLVAGLNALPGCRASTPAGAFYVWCNVSGLGQPAALIAARWLEDVCVATVPGEGFGSPAHIRFSFATSMDKIDEGLRRLSTWIQSH